MKWSVSKSRIFSKCQKKWYYSEIVATHGKKDQFRRQIYLLKQLKSIYSWRGDLVDKVIGKTIIPGIKKRNLPSEEEVINYATQLAERQLTFANTQKYLYTTKKEAGDDYCAIYDLEYHGEINSSQIDEAQKDIKMALTNFMRSSLLKSLCSEDLYFLTQRTLSFNFAGAVIYCIPDLIVFHKKNPPTIIDWKVHTFGNTEYWLQLGIYGFVLSQMQPHTDFLDFKELLSDPTKFVLIEYQLLKDVQRIYDISPEELSDIEDYIFTSITQINSLVNEKKYGEIDIGKFQTAHNSDVCMNCEFRKVCWEDNRNGTN